MGTLAYTYDRGLFSDLQISFETTFWGTLMLLHGVRVGPSVR